jgi:hypothetical protein
MVIPTLHLTAICGNRLGEMDLSKIPRSTGNSTVFKPQFQPNVYAIKRLPCRKLSFR